VADTDTRLSLYQCLAGARNTEGVEVLGQGLQRPLRDSSCRGGQFALRGEDKGTGAKAKLESISTEGSLIVLRRPSGMQFPPEAGKLARTGVKVSLNQVRLDTGRARQGLAEGAGGRGGELGF